MGFVNPPRCIMSVDCGAVKALTPSDGYRGRYCAAVLSLASLGLGAIRSAGGKAVLAHPASTIARIFDDAVRRMAEAGLDGPEVLYAYDPEARGGEATRRSPVSPGSRSASMSACQFCPWL